MEVNENNKLCNVMGLQMIVNTENGAVVGVDKDGIKQYKSIEAQDDLLIKDKELYDFLIENDFIYYKKQRKKAGINISTAYVHVTNMCNLHCIGCYSNNKSRNRDIDLSKQDMFKVIDQLKSININQLVISGGEPLLRKDIIDIIEYAKDICKIGEIILITNGTIGDNDLYSKLTKWVDKVAVSLDTFNANVDHYLRDRGIYNKIIQNIRNMQVSGLKISILPTIHHKNVHYVEKYVELAKKLGTEISFSIFTTNNENIYEDFKLTAEDLKYIGENFADFDIHDLPINNRLEGKKYCGAGRNIISIGADGSVYPCHMLMNRKYKLGNILDKPVKDILEKCCIDKKLINDVNRQDKCKKCEFRYFCGGGCRARAFLLTGNTSSVDPFCEMYKEFYHDTILSIIECLTNKS